MTRPRPRGLLAAVAMVVLLAVQAAPVGAAGTRWGSKLDTNLQPSNGSRHCGDGAPHPICSWMFRSVLGRSGGQKAPKDGFVSKVRLIACHAGSFYLQFGKVRKEPGASGEYQAKVRATSAKVSFHGDADCNAPYSIETINIPDVFVRKGEYFGVRAKNPKALRCDSGGPNVLEFEPPLSDGGSYKNPDDTNGCRPTIELEYRP